MIPVFLAALLLSVTPHIALAQTATPAPALNSSDQPLEITADSALEWNSEKKQYVARKNAKAVQGDFSASANTLTADYTDGKGGGTQITRLTAEGNAVITSAGNSVHGERAVYDVATGKVVVTGKDLKLVGTNLTVTAKEKFEYFEPEGKLIAYGRPLVTSGTDTLEADMVTAWIARSSDTKAAPAAKDQSGLKRAEANGNVVITTPKERATGDNATYNAETSLAELIGHAVVSSGDNKIEGTRAEMNLKTKVSRMISTDGTGRVKGVFFPVNRKHPTIPKQ
jgi:lipopolysaccharide export system protein LptA